MSYNPCVEIDIYAEGLVSGWRSQCCASMVSVKLTQMPGHPTYSRIHMCASCNQECNAYYQSDPDEYDEMMDIMRP